MTPTKKIQQELEPFLYSLDDWKDYIRKVTKKQPLHWQAGIMYTSKYCWKILPAYLLKYMI